MVKQLSFKRSTEMFERAKKSIAGGVNTLGRRPHPEYIPDMPALCIEKAKGSRIYDIDGNEFIDYHMAYGPIILGHAHQKVNEAVRKSIEKGVLYGLNHELEVELCEKLVRIIPCADLVRITNSGSSATASAIRIARAYTGKTKVVKFEGHYHGWHDWNMVDNTITHTGYLCGGEKIPLKTLTTEGVPESILNDVIVLPWNDIEAVEKVVKRQGSEIAVIITEAYMNNRGCIPPKPGYLEALRKITEENEIVLIFDEVITGFRYSLGGAQEYLGVTPDMATFAKAMANGFPIAVVAGKQEVMEPLANYRTWLAGTYNASHASVAASVATLNELEAGDRKVYKHIYNVSGRLIKGIKDAIEDVDIEAIVQGPGPAFSTFFTELDEIWNVRDVIATVEETRNKRRAATVNSELMKRGIYIQPHPRLRAYHCAAHTEEDADKTIEAFGEAVKLAKKVS